MTKLNQEVAAIMERLPLLYPASKYNTGFRRFIVIEEELRRMGIVAAITRIVVRHTDNKPTVRYSVTWRYSHIANYKYRVSAKNKIFKMYLYEKGTLKTDLHTNLK